MNDEYSITKIVRSHGKLLSRNRMIQYLRIVTNERSFVHEPLLNCQPLFLQCSFSFINGNNALRIIQSVYSKILRERHLKDH